MKKIALPFLILVLQCQVADVTAQPKVEELKFGKTLTTTLDKAGAVKQSKLLTDIIKSAATNFVNNKGKMIWDHSTDPGIGGSIIDQTFESDFRWPGNPHSTIEGGNTILAGAVLFEKWEARFGFYDEQDFVEALRIFNKVYNQVNEAVIHSAAGKGYMLKAEFISPKAGDDSLKKASIYFDQLEETEKIQVWLSFDSDTLGYYTIALQISKSEFKKVK